MNKRALTALAALTAALAVAAPAVAETNQTQPPAKKGCTIQLQGPGAGQSIEYPDGYKFSVYSANDRKTHTYTCDDGSWKETVTLTAGLTTLRISILSASGGMLQAIQL